MRFVRLTFTGLFLMLISPLMLAQEPETTSLAKRTPSYTEQGVEVCLRCHSGPKIQAIQVNAHGRLENLPAPLVSRGCESCHGPGSIHISRAHGGRGFPPLTAFGRGSSFSPRDEQINACLSCHEYVIGDKTSIRFRGSPHDRRNINCTTCHLVHAESDPIGDRSQQADTCYRCHRKQKNSHPRFENKSIDFDSLTCWTCHDVHTAVSRPEPLGTPVEKPNEEADEKQ